MEAIEFTAEAKDGVIEIPKESLLEAKKVPRNKRVLSALKMKTKGFQFDREEANSR